MNLNMSQTAKISAWLLFLVYLLIGLGGIVSAAEMEGGGSGCIQGAPREGCCASCGEESSLSHLRPSPAAKRLAPVLLAPSPFRVAEPPPADAPEAPSAHRHARLPNVTLAALRTVVLLN